MGDHRKRPPMGRTERLILGGFEDEFKAHDVHELAEAVKAWVPFFGEHLEPVSYTHLTLPTSDLV